MDNKDKDGQLPIELNMEPVGFFFIKIVLDIIITIINLTLKVIITTILILRFDWIAQTKNLSLSAFTLR